MALALALVFALGVDIWGMSWGLPNTFSWSPDSSVPMTTLRGAMLGFSHGFVGQHQPLQPMLIATLTAPYFAHLVMTGELDRSAIQRSYPWGLKDPVTALTVVIVIGRALSVAAHLVFIWAMFRMGLLIGGRVSGLAAGMLAATCYPITHYASVGAPEMLYVCLMAIALWAYLLVLRKPTVDLIAVLACASALSASVKFQAVPFFAGMLPVVSWVLWRARDDRSLAVSRRPVLAMALTGTLVFGGTFVVANNIVLNPSGFTGYFTTTLSGTSKGPDGVPKESPDAPEKDPRWGSSFAERSARRFADGVGYPVLLLAVLAVADMVRRRSGLLPALLAPFLAYGVFYWWVNKDILRYLFPMMLVCLAFAAYGWGVLWEAAQLRRHARPALIVAAVLSVAFLSARAVSVSWEKAHDTRYDVERWFAAETGGAPVTVELYQTQHHMPRFGEHVQRLELTSQGWFAEDRDRVDVRRYVHGERHWRDEHPELFNIEAVRERGADYIIIYERKEPDRAIAAMLDAAGSGYVCVARFGRVPLYLDRQQPRTSIPYRIYRLRGGGEPGGR